MGWEDVSVMSRKEFRGWPSRKPVWTITAFVVALLSVPLFAYTKARLTWSPLECLYLRQYVVGALKIHLSYSKVGGPYRVLEVVNKKGEAQMALDGDVVPIETSGRAGEIPVALSDEAQRTGWVSLRVTPPRDVDHVKFHSYIRHWIYKDVGLRDVALGALVPGAAVLVLGLYFAFPVDRRRWSLRKYGRRLRGPELVSVEDFNASHKADGVCLVGESPRGLLIRLKRLVGIETPRSAVCLPRSIESSHMSVMGDSGTGKGVTMAQLLEQVASRNESAIVYDPALEYLPRFYRPERGDVVLNPIDRRCPYWNPGAELKSDAEAATLAKSLFPDKSGNENRFFVETPRKIIAHLLRQRPTVEQLVEWLCNPLEIDRLVRGTELAAMIEPRAASQRAGVLSSLNLIADALKLLPRKHESTTSWTAAEWSKKPRGWIFITSTPETREALLPLISFFLDLLVLRLMTQGVMNPKNSGSSPVWFFIDELATLQRLPQLHTAITENRKTGNPVVLGFQGRSQLEARYGDDAEAMLSQPATKVFLRTSEPRAAKWISETIGRIEIERIRESRTDGRFAATDRHSKSDMLECTEQDLVMASEIGGLPNLSGYLKCGNLVVPLSLAYFDLPEEQPRFVERRPSVADPVPAATAVPPATPSAASVDVDLDDEQPASEPAIDASIDSAFFD